jgi:RNA ligase (TIGR02306 family)
MASELIVPVTKITNVRPHTNADSLELCDVLGYQMCVPKGKYKGGELVVYFPADVLIPAEWADKFGVKKYLKGVENDRVGRVRLRGEPSFGLVQDIPAGQNWQEGENVADYFGIKKYVPPIKSTCGDAAERDPFIDPFFQKFTDVQNGRIFTDVLVEGEEVIFTEKIHGTNCRVGMIDGKLVAGSMEVRRKSPCDADGNQFNLYSDEMKRNTYWCPMSIVGVTALLTDLAIDKTPVILYGEVYGGNVQSLDYGIPAGKFLGFRAFGLRVADKFLSWDDFYATCGRYGVETVPVLWRGAFSMAKAKELADGQSTMAGHIREGTVVYPVQERLNPKVGRAILKFIGTEYELSKHKDKDTTDV